MLENNIETKDPLKEAADLIAECVQTDDQCKKVALSEAVYKLLRPLVETHPKAAFNVAYLAEHFARYDWPGPAGTEDDRHEMQIKFYDKALEHYAMLANAPRGMFIGEDRWLRCKAQVQMAQLYEDDIIGLSDPSLIFRLRQSAAHDDYAPAQVLLADMHALGRGTPVNKRAARYWLYKALGNADQLQPEILAYADETHTKISHELGLPDIRPGRPITGTSSSKPHKPD